MEIVEDSVNKFCLVGNASVSLDVEAKEAFHKASLSFYKHDSMTRR